MKSKLKLYFLLLVLLSLPALARAQGTAFSYQGHLVENGLAANSAHDFIFSLFDSAAAGAQVGQDVTLNNTAVANGQFNVTLDFAAGAFTGDPRWLEISVRPTGVGQFTKMDTRAPLLPTPYAIFAARAGSVANGAVTANQLSTGGVAPAPGQFLSYNGGNLVWSDPGAVAGNVWSLNGTSASYSAGNVGIGTSIPMAGVELEVNGTTRITPGGSGGFVSIGTPNGETGLGIIGVNRADIRFDGSTLKLLAGLGATSPANGIAVNTLGNVGIGTFSPTPGVELEVNGTTRITPGGSGGFVSIGTPGGETGIGLVGNNRADLRFDGSTVKLVAGSGSGAPPSGNGIAVTTSGYVGIGTTTPIAKLDAENADSGKSAVFGRETGTTGIGVYGEATAASGAGVFARNLNGVALQADGDVVQTRDKGGTVKAMVLMHYDGTIPTFFRGYNGVTGSSTGQCGFTYGSHLSGIFGFLHTTINFGFKVNDRFISLTAVSGEVPQGVSVYGFPDENTIDIRNDGDFYLIIY